MTLRERIDREIGRLSESLARMQSQDGSWKLCYENVVLTEAYMILLLRTIEDADEELIRLLHDRLLAAQYPDGSWRAYPDEQEGNLSATVECYYAMLYSGYSQASDPWMAKARSLIVRKGGLARIKGLMTKVMLAATGQIPWPRFLRVPLEFLLLPSAFPINLYEFSVYARAHMIPAMVIADRRFSVRTNRSPVLAELIGDSSLDRLSFWDDDEHGGDSRTFESVLTQIVNGINSIKDLSELPHDAAIKRAELYMLERIEPDGTLYSYATSTFLMVFALLAIGYGKRHPVIHKAVRGLKGLICRTENRVFVQNSPSEVWDTALLSYALQEAGVTAHSPTILGAADYLLARQHRRSGDWAIHNPSGVVGGWGFSDSNTLNPDVDDTTAALRAIKSLSAAGSSYLEAWNRGLSWLLSMQNDDGGWPAFEKNTDRRMLASLPLVEAKSSAIDPSTPDLTGRTLSFLGQFAGLDVHRAFVRKGADWLIASQEQDGSWYGRWGVCFIYGTWAALTGLSDVGIGSDHPAVTKGVKWLADIQNDDGGWGESCASDVTMRYVPLHASTPSQTAWALDALIAVHDKPTIGMDTGIDRLLQLSQDNGWVSSYPTGAGLPGIFYSHYHSYRYIWPLLTLAHYKRKYL